MKSKNSNYILISILAIIAVLAGIYWQDLINIFSDQQKIISWVGGFGYFGPLVFIILQAAQVIITPLPGAILSFASGYLFGFLWGVIYSLGGIVLGSTAIFYLTRRLGRGFVENHLDKKLLDRFDYISKKAGPLVFFILFLLPFPPDDLVCFLAGLTSIPIPFLILIVILGRLPLVILTVTSSSLLALDWNNWLVLGIILIFVIIAFLLYIYSEKIIQLFKK